MVDYSDSWTPAGDFGIVEDVNTTGGFRVVADSAERLSIPALRRKKGMRVVQADTNVVYILNTNNLGALSESDFIEDPSGDVSLSGDNTFTGTNTFNKYITGSITGSDAKFSTLSGNIDWSYVDGAPSFITSNEQITITGDASGTGTTSISLSNVTASYVTSSVIENFTEDVRAQFSAGSNVTILDGVISSTAGGTGDVVSTGNNTFTGVNTFNTNYITGSITGSDAKFVSLTSSIELPDRTITINTASPIDASILSMRLTSTTSGFFKSNTQYAVSSYAEGLGIASNGKVLGFTYNDVPAPLGTQKIGGLSINSGDDYVAFQVGKPTTLAYSLAGSAVNVWNEAGLLGASAIRNSTAATGPTDPDGGVNYYYMYSIGSEKIYSAQFPAFSLSRARNNFTSPGAVQSGDILGILSFEGRTTTGTATQINVNDYRTACFVAGIAEQTFSDTSYGGGLGFWTIPNGTNIRPVSQAPAMWINNEGNVGIGLGASSTTPFSPVQAQHKLEVNGTALIKNNLIVEGSTTSNIEVSGSFASPIQLSNYTLTSNDKGKTILFSSTAQQSITCSSGLDVGFNCSFVQIGTGQIIISAGPGVTLYNRQNHTGSAGQYAVISVVSIDTDKFIIAGDTI